MCAVIMVLKVIFFVLSFSGFLVLAEDVEFVEIPQDTEVAVDHELLLRCKANATLEECQWSWKSLDDDENDTLTVVKTYPPFGENHSDCTVKFSNVLVEQQGFWICGVRTSGNETFKTTPPAKLLTRYEVKFSDLTKDTIFESGQKLLLLCKTQRAVKECLWTWKPLNSKNTSELTVKIFKAFGNESQDCSIRLNSVLPEQAGYWTCGAKDTEEDFTLARPIKLTLRKPQEVEFSDVMYDTEMGAGKPLVLTCKTTKPVEECQWTWKSDKNPDSVLMRQFQSFGNESRDCSLRFEIIASEHEGIWTCAARYEWQTTFTAAHPIQLTVLTGLEFVQLSQDIQVAIGEPILLRCVTNTAVELCQWSWQHLNQTNDTAVVVKQFPAFGEDGRDCSVRFKSVLEEQEGIWICSVRLYTHSSFVTASPPATLTLLPAVRIKFLERPEDVRVAIGESVLLRCIATTAVTDCMWNWRPLTEPNKTELVVKRFPAFGNHSRDCSVRFRNVMREQEGLWGCTVTGAPNRTQLASSPARLTVFDPVPINFNQLSREVQMPPGGSLLLRCVTDKPVEECKWSWQPPDETNTTEVEIKKFPAYGNGSRDCSFHFDVLLAEHEGNWTCAARNAGESHFKSAPPARVMLIQPESVMVALWSAPEHKVTLACRLSSPRPIAVCRWDHPPNTTLTIANTNNRFLMEYNASMGICTVVFAPEMIDMGQWTCVFTINNWELASATLVLLTTPADEKLSWLVGVLAAMVLLLTVVLVGVVVCKCRKQTFFDKDGLGSPVLRGSSGGKQNRNSYTDTPTKINFQFREAPGRAPPSGDVTAVTTSTINSPQHIYEHVDRYASPSPSKSIYENVE